MITLEQIQKRLTEAIKNSGKSQKEIAKALNLSPSAISGYANGTRIPALDTLANLCKLLDEDTKYILCLK